MRGGVEPPFRENLIVRARLFLFAKLTRGLLTLREFAFRQKCRSRAKAFVRGDDTMHTLDYIAIGVLIACMLVAGTMVLHKAR